MHSPADLLEELLEAIAKTLVDHPEGVQVRAVPEAVGDYPRTAGSSGRRRFRDRPPWTHSRRYPHDSRSGWYEAA